MRKTLGESSILENVTCSGRYEPFISLLKSDLKDSEGRFSWDSRSKSAKVSWGCWYTFELIYLICRGQRIANNGEFLVVFFKKNKLTKHQQPYSVRHIFGANATVLFYCPRLPDINLERNYEGNKNVCRCTESGMNLPWIFIGKYANLRCFRCSNAKCLLRKYYKSRNTRMTVCNTDIGNSTFNCDLVQ